MPPEKGALVPGSPATIPETEQGFDKVKNRYEDFDGIHWIPACFGGESRVSDIAD